MKGMEERKREKGKKNRERKGEQSDKRPRGVFYSVARSLKVRERASHHWRVCVRHVTSHRWREDDARDRSPLVLSSWKDLDGG